VTHREHHAAVLSETVRLYRSGLSLAQVAARMDVFAPQVRNRLVEAGEPRRSPGRPKGQAQR
jgi:hypothetical protein